ncbi:MAG: 2-oxo-4-hydroxy-4-carboxy-5-ureidoimidazoline decarboxylase [Jiangellaceae bacterium]
MTAFDGLGLDGFNALPDDRAEEALLACCASPAWVRAVGGHRPYRDAGRLFAAADAALARMSDNDLDDALAGHPRIGDRPDGEWSRREQAGVHDADAATRHRLAEANRAYEDRFGHVYLVCATGKSAEELLAILAGRVGNDPPSERATVRAELGKINRIRLQKLLGDARTEGEP